MFRAPRSWKFWAPRTEFRAPRSRIFCRNSRLQPLFLSSSATTSSVLARARRRKVGFRRNLVCWILDFQRNPRSPDSQNLVKVSSVELRFSSAAVDVDRILGDSLILRLGHFQSIQQVVPQPREFRAARNCTRVGACLSSTEIRCILGWVAPTSATPESGFVLSRWCRSCQLDLLSTDQLVWIEPDSRNGAETGVFTVPGTEPQVPAAAPSADQDRGKGVAS
uniref:Uncharacterized protein n=1 Tax=Ananas comosus var. bracteatus TaxID=296719 RepID=A0A6V7Q0D5_ANACO|nr:unnamed protein product [Ananas comosus var. bracteatus]